MEAILVNVAVALATYLAHVASAKLLGTAIPGTSPAPARPADAPAPATGTPGAAPTLGSGLLVSLLMRLVQARSGLAQIAPEEEKMFGAIHDELAARKVVASADKK